MPDTRPRAVLFDFGETLMHEGPPDAVAGARNVLALVSANPRRISAEDLAATLMALHEDLDARRQRSQLEPAPHTWMRLVYEPLGITFTVDPAEVEWAHWSAALPWTLEPDVGATLALLRELGLPWGVIGNTMFRAATIERQLTLSGLTGFRFVLTSADYTFRKPNRRMFDLAAGRLGLSTGAIWFVGDSHENDMMGAAAAGMVPVWYRRFNDGKTDSAPAAHVVDSWQAFNALLKS